MNFEFARENMIKQQVMPEGIAVGNLIDAMSKTAREDFLPTKYKNLAYCDTQIIVDDNEIKSPMLVAKLIYALQITKAEKILKLGLESGYTAALFSRMAKSVTVIDSDDKKRDTVESLLTATNLTNLKVDGTDYLAEIMQKNEKFDCIFISSILSEEELDGSLFELLEIGGRAAFIVSSNVHNRAYLITRVEDKHYKKEFLFDLYSQ